MTAVDRGRDIPYISGIGVEGYKSIGNSVELDIRPLTVIAGANSSGKSSFMQPILLLKQTLEAPYNAGPLLLYGDNVKLTRWDQAVSRGKSKSKQATSLVLSLSAESDSIRNTYRYGGAISGGVDLVETAYVRGDTVRALTSKMTQRKILEAMVDSEAFQVITALLGHRDLGARSPIDIDRLYKEEILPENLILDVRESKGFLSTIAESPRFGTFSAAGPSSLTSFSDLVQSVIHVPGLRGNPERLYMASNSGATFPGTFDQYVAGLIYQWQHENKAQARGLVSDLQQLGLTWKIEAQKRDDVQLEILVGRLPQAQQGGARDLVSIADVGFGVSQTLPVLVALRAASKGDLVYIEQPELHLHPRAQASMANVLVAAANRGVRVVAETHSSLLLRSVQTAIARGHISELDVSMNWFSRSFESGATTVSRADLDGRGRFGDWPEDFDAIAEKVDWEFFLAAESDSES